MTNAAGLPPYFLESAALCALATALIFSFRRHRKLLIAGGALLGPFSIFAIYHVPAFWRPITTTGGRLNPEDLLWTFAQGVLSVAIAIVPMASRIRADVRLAAVVTRWLRLGALWLLAFMVCSFWLSRPTDVMWLTLAPAMCLVPVLIALRPQLWPLAVSGGLGFAVFHAIELICTWRIWPAMPGYYVQESQLPWHWFGVHGFEWVFALVLGCSWPLAIGYLCDLRFAEEPEVVSTASSYNPA